MKQTLYKYKKYIIPLIELTSPFKLSSNKLDIFSIGIIISKVFLGKGVLKTCSKFTGEHPHRSAILIKLQFIEITLQHGCSLANLLHIFRTPFLKNTSCGLLLSFEIYLHLEEVSTRRGTNVQYLVDSCHVTTLGKCCMSFWVGSFHLSHHPSKFVGYAPCKSEYKIFLICQVTTQSKCYVTL